MCVAYCYFFSRFLVSIIDLRLYFTDDLYLAVICRKQLLISSLRTYVFKIYAKLLHKGHTSHRSLCSCVRDSLQGVFMDIPFNSHRKFGCNLRCLGWYGTDRNSIQIHILIFWFFFNASILISFMLRLTSFKWSALSSKVIHPPAFHTILTYSWTSSWVLMLFIASFLAYLTLLTVSTSCIALLYLFFCIFLTTILLGHLTLNFGYFMLCWKLC